MSAPPSYDLTLIQALVGQGAYHVTQSAIRTAVEVRCDQADIEECVLAPSDFHKSMAAEQRPGTMQDVYRPIFRARALYVKLQLATAANGDTAVVISFKAL